MFSGYSHLNQKFKEIAIIQLADCDEIFLEVVDSGVARWGRGGGGPTRAALVKGRHFDARRKNICPSLRTMFFFSICRLTAAPNFCIVERRLPPYIVNVNKNYLFAMQYLHNLVCIFSI